MSNIGPPNWWLRDKMIELTDKTLDVINRTEEKLNTKIDNISETQYITNNTYNNMTDIIDKGTTNSLTVNIVSTSSLRGKTERQSINVTSASGDNHSVYSISVNKNKSNKLTVSFQENINGVLVYSNSGLKDIFTGKISFANSLNIINKYSLHISQTDIIQILPEQNLDNILTIIGDINSSTINSWENTQDGFYIFTLDKDIVNVNDTYFNNTNNSSTIIFNGTLVFTELVGSFPLVIGNIDEKNIEIKSLHTKLEGNLLDIENNFTNISGNTLSISGNTLSISANTNIQGQDINIGTNNTTHNLIIGNQNNNTTMYNVLTGNLNTNLLQTNSITVTNILIPVSWKDISLNEQLQAEIYSNKLRLYYLKIGQPVSTYEDSSPILLSKLQTFITEKYSYLGSNFLTKNLFSLYDNIENLNKFSIKIHDITNSQDYPLRKIISVNTNPEHTSGKYIELELDGNITSDYSTTYSPPFEAQLEFIIQEEENILNINNLHGKINLYATEGAFNFTGNLTINAGNLTEVVREYVDICSNKIILNGNVTGLTLTPDAFIEARHHEGKESYGTITYSGTDKEWKINPSINSINHITSGTYITAGTDLTVNNSATINNKLNVTGATTLNNSLYVKEATTLNSSLYVKGATTLNNSLICNGSIIGNQGIYTNSGLFMYGMIPSVQNNVSSGININGFTWKENSSDPLEITIPAPQKIIYKDYILWGSGSKPGNINTDSNTDRLISISLNKLILNTWDTYHIITSQNTGKLDFQTTVPKETLILDGKPINNIKVFHNSKSVVYAPNINTNTGLLTNHLTQSNLCTQISLYSFIETTTIPIYIAFPPFFINEPVYTLILNIHTVDNNYIISI